MEREKYGAGAHLSRRGRRLRCKGAQRVREERRIWSRGTHRSSDSTWNRLTAREFLLLT